MYSFLTNTFSGKKLCSIYAIVNGTIVPQKEVDGRNCYRVNFPETTQITEGDKTFCGNVVDYAYKEEILEYIESKTFEYNEDLK
jgi:hypothetical protein